MLHHKRNYIQDWELKRKKVVDMVLYLSGFAMSGVGAILLLLSGASL
jgi:hypothetical protein